MRNYLLIVLCLFLILTSLPSSSQTEAPFYDAKEKKGLKSLFKKKEQPPESEEQIYQRALAEFEGKPTWLAKKYPEKAEKARESKLQKPFYYRVNYQASIELFQKLIYEYPFTRYLVDADFYIAEAYFKSKDYDIALQAYQDFLVRHPRNSRAEYVHYQIGLCHFQKRKKNPLRDQSETISAIQAFQLLLINYPETCYKEKALDYIKICEETLAEHEIKIADFYYQKKEFFSASLRYHRAVSEYPESSKADYALFKEGLSLEKLSRNEDAIRIFTELLTNYPQSKYINQVSESLKKLNEKSNP